LDQNTDLELDGLEILYSKHAVQSAVASLAQSMVEYYDNLSTINVVPVMTGGMQFSASLLSELERIRPGKWLVSPIFASAYSSDEVLAEPTIEFPTTFDNRVDLQAPTVVVDDLLDTGTTMMKLMKDIQSRGIQKVDLAVLIDRKRNQPKEIVPRFCGFQLKSDRWLVGFGMDSEQRYRGLEAVYVQI
jgi:hypoxanthine phosphoribosyltransferase